MFMSSFIQYILLKDLKGFSSQELCQGPQIISNTKFDCWWLSEIFFSRKQKFLGAKLCVKNGKNWRTNWSSKQSQLARNKKQLNSARYCTPIIIKKLKQTGKKVLYNTSKIQNINSSRCGYYCYLYIIMRDKGMNPYDILYQFHPDGKKKW